MRRAANRQSSIYLGKDGYWHGRVTVGRKDDGSLDRRHVMSKSKATVITKVRALERLRDEVRVPKVGRAWTVEKWLLHWLEEIARPNIRDSSYLAYRAAITKHLLPSLGNLRLDRLSPETIEAVYRRMIDAGAKPATAHQAHRTLRAALGEAERRGHIARNPAQLVRPPRIQQEPVEPFTPGRGAAGPGRCTGLSQRRTVGDRAGPGSAPRRGARAPMGRPRPEGQDRARPRYPAASGLRARMRRHVRQDRGLLPGPASSATDPRAPPSRPPATGSSACPTNSSHSSSPIAEPRSPNDLRRARSGRRAAGSSPPWLGRPINPNTDYLEWEALLQRAGVRHARLHDARHTAATVLLVLGVPERTVMSIMGWSSTSMAARYQHVTDPIRREVANRVGDLLFGESGLSNGI